jgi:hypothetical protein
MLKKILLGLIVVVVAFLAFAATRPDRYHVERSASIAAPPAVVFAELEDLRRWSAWSPWDKIDPNMKKEYSGPERGVGASYSWQGNKDVGKGQMTIVTAEPPTKVAYKLEFIEPFASVADTSFTVAPAGADGSEVTWSIDGHNDFMGKVFSVFMDMDKMLGADFEKGLAQLKPIAEAEAKKRRAAGETATAAPATPRGEPGMPAGPAM